VHIKTGLVSRFFGNIWGPKNAIIFKGWGVFSPPPPLLFLMSC
jgi:hypothetical protein